MILRRWTAARSLLAATGAELLRLLAATWRLRFEHAGDDPMAATDHEARLGGLWHRDMLIAAGAFRDRSFSVPVSRSRDGDLINIALLRLGFERSPRGSSSRGGSTALLGLAKLMRTGVSVAIPTDGPRGPAGQSKPGVAMLARISGVPITPVAFSARPCLHFASWDRTRLPLPFARVVCRFGPPIAVAADADPPSLARAAQELDSQLAQLSEQPQAATP